MALLTPSSRFCTALVFALLAIATASEAAAAPVNDTFVNAATLVWTASTSSLGATAEPGEPAHAGSPAQASVWWTYTAIESRPVEIETVGSDFDTRLAVYSGTALNALTLVASSDDISTVTPQSRVRFNAVAGTAYHVAVDGFGGETGRVDLTVRNVTTPANDDFAARTDLGDVSIFADTASNVAATTEAGEPAHAGQNAAASIWWRWTAPTTGVVQIDTLGSAVDTVLAVYTGTSLDTLTLVSANDDAETGTLQSRLRFTATAGTTYSIAVDSFQDGTGTIALNLNLGNPGTPPVNDNFAAYSDLGNGIIAAGAADNEFATAEASEPAHAGSLAAGSVWWRWTAPVSGPVVIDTLGSPVDTTLAVYTGTAVSALTEVASNDDIPGGKQSRVSFTAIAGTAYRIAVDGFSGARGNLVLALQLTPPSPGNDNFVNAISLGQAATATGAGDNFAATADVGEPLHAGTVAAASAWWRWTAPVSADVEVNTIGSSFNTRLAIYTGSTFSALTAVASNDDASAAQTSKVRFAAVAGAVYHIAVDGTNNGRGIIALEVKPAPPLPPPDNDNFVSRTNLGNGDTVSTSGDNTRATAESGEPAHAGGDPSASVWWSWTTSADGLATISTAGSGIDTRLAVYTGTTISGLTRVAENDEAAPTSGSSLVRFFVSAGTSYHIAVDGFQGDQGALNLSIERRNLDEDEGNDRFADRFELGSSPTVTTTGSNFGARAETGEPAHAGTPAVASVWWEWIAPASGQVTVSTAGSDFDTRLAIYTGNAVNALTVVAANNDFDAGTQSQVQFPVVAGTPYIIAVDGNGGAEGRIALSLAPGIPAPLPANDAFSARIDFGSSASVAVVGSNVEATAEGDEPPHGGLPAAHSVWWQWTAPTTGRFAIDLSQSAFSVRAAIYTGSAIATLTPLISNTIDERLFDFEATAGTTYQIAIDGFAGESGAIAFKLRPAPPLNDAFADAFILGNSTAASVTGTNVAATAETGEPVRVGQDAIASVWWSWTAPASGLMTVDTIGSDFDTVLGVFTGSAVNALALVGNNDDLDAATSQSRVSFAVTEGTTYYFVVDGFAGITGQIRLNLTESKKPQPPDNDAFANAIDLGSGELLTKTANNVRATAQTSEPAHAGNPPTASVWFKWTAPRSATVDVNTLGSAFDTVLAIHTGTALGALTPVAENDDADGGTLQSAVSFAAVAGTVYYIAVDGVGGEQGAITLHLNTSAPDNDRFANRFDLGRGAAFQITANSAGATAEVDEPAHAGVAVRASVWWSWTAPVNMPVEINTLGSGFDTTLAVYTGTAFDTLTEIASNNDIAGGTSSRVRFNAVAGTVYLVAVDAVEGEGGAIVLRLLENIFGNPPINDTFTNAINFTGNSLSLAGSNVNATFETGEPAHAGQTAKNTVWWKWTAPTNGLLTVDTTGSAIDTVLAVYSGISVAALTPLAANDDSTPQIRQSLVALPVTTGVTYHIAVDGSGGVTGTLVVRVNFKTDYDVWSASNFPPGTVASDSAPDRDFDGDSLTNGIEYLLDLNPSQPNAGGLEIARIEDATVLTYPRRREAASGIDVVEASVALQSWTTLQASDVSIVHTDNGSSQPDTVRVTIPDSLGFRFFRLRVSIEP